MTMWPFEYIMEVRRALRDQHNFIPTGGTEDEPIMDVPDGEYEITVNERTFTIHILKNAIDHQQ